MSVTDDIRAQFPALQQTVYGKHLVYFDNAATSQKPQAVLDLIGRMNSLTNANVHRAVHKLSVDATELYEAGREAARRFIGASCREEVVFTSGATAALNLLATCFTRRFVAPGEKILISEAEHHSNIVSWQIACAAVGASIEVVKVADDGMVDMADLERKLTSDVRLLSITHASNVLGVVNPVADIVAMAHSRGIPVAVDGAQSVVHCPIDVQRLDCDFFVFSAHKIYGATGTGVLYGRRSLLEQLPPYMGGGDMVDTVSFEGTTYAELPLKFEAGTPNFIGASTLAPALEFASRVNGDPELMRLEREMVEYLATELPAIDGLRLYGMPSDLSLKIPVFSMTVDGTHPSDLAQILDKMGIAVRSGLMCAEPLIRKYSDRGMLRASLMPYNTLEECETFVKGLGRAVAMLG